MPTEKAYGIYCSGSASRVMKFFGNDANKDLTPRFIIYDGGNRMVYSEIKALLPKTKIYEFILNDYGEKAQRCPNTIFSNLLLEIMLDESCDKLLCFGKRIFKQKIISRFYGNLINFHPSILPAFPGIQAIDQAMANKSQLLGNTAHFIDEGIDTGRIVVQTAIPFSDFKSYDDVLCLQLPMIKVVLKYCFGYSHLRDENIHKELRLLSKNAILCYDKNCKDF